MPTQDIFYLGMYDNMIKGGQTYDVRKRWGRSQYNQGGGYQLPSCVYFANPAVQFPIDKLAMFYERKYYKFLKHQRGNFRKKLEFIDPRYSHITIDDVQNELENYIRANNMSVLRLKKEFINIIPYTPSFCRDVREDYLKYCEPV